MGNPWSISLRCREEETTHVGPQSIYREGVNIMRVLQRQSLERPGVLEVLGGSMMKQGHFKSATTKLAHRATVSEGPNALSLSIDPGETSN